MALSRIHVNRQIIQRDNKRKSISKAVGVETSGMRKRYGFSVSIKGPSRVVYRPQKPLKCGAKCWMETHAPVVVHRRQS